MVTFHYWWFQLFTWRFLLTSRPGRFLGGLFYYYVHRSWVKSPTLFSDCYIWDSGPITCSQLYTKGHNSFQILTRKILVYTADLHQFQVLVIGYPWLLIISACPWGKHIFQCVEFHSRDDDCTTSSGTTQYHPRYLQDAFKIQFEDMLKY